MGIMADDVQKRISEQAVKTCFSKTTGVVKKTTYESLHKGIHKYVF